MVGTDDEGAWVGIDTVGDSVTASSHRVHRCVRLASYRRTQAPRHKSVSSAFGSGTVKHGYSHTASVGTPVGLRVGALVGSGLGNSEGEVEVGAAVGSDGLGSAEGIKVGE